MQLDSSKEKIMENIKELVNEEQSKARIKIWMQDVNLRSEYYGDMSEADIVEVIYAISFEKGCKYSEAIEMIKNSTIEKPIKINFVIYWLDKS